MATKIELIKELRKTTQASIMDCKKALEQNNDDLEKAIKWLRENGIVKSAKKLGKVAADGCIVLHSDHHKAVMVEINSQTDFVARSQELTDFAQLMISEVFKKATPTTTIEEVTQYELQGKEKVAERLALVASKTDEKIVLRRLMVFESKTNHIFSYLHANKRIGVILEVEGKFDEQDGKHLAMHIAANSPQFIDQDNVDQTWLANETSIIKSQAKLEVQDNPKKAAFLDKTIAGRVNKLLIDICLVNQKYLVDESKTVGQFLKEKNSKVIHFVRFEVGEGIVKEAVDFASEVSAQMKK
ncbi:translation elongation factor Ts [Mycoplasmoides pneumoniae]|uniref:translation elongation factor Ts n=1 Tax=Mycoplasmoides pneumoniae TaxID=2104 RepID=UPI000375E632|nr:translation elongation factor Ts [Mycoplasmoides pneumoniae]ALA39653.1 elongation factor Ts [Mycoplasmoides pneumoniae PO1]